jgi:hypothetical protein
MLASGMAEAARYVIVNQPARLHKGVANGGADELTTAFFQCC